MHNELQNLNYIKYMCINNHENIHVEVNIHKFWLDQFINIRCFLS